MYEFSKFHTSVTLNLVSLQSSKKNKGLNASVTSLEEHFKANTSK